MSSTTLFQAQNTQTTNGTFIPDAQVTELYKIVKQNDYLKKRLTATEKTLNDATKMNDEYKVLKGKLESVIKLQNEELKKTSEAHNKAIEIKNAQMMDINRQLEESYTDAKKQGRRKFWKGFAIGGVTVGIIGTGTAIYFLTR